MAELVAADNDGDVAAESLDVNVAEIRAALRLLCQLRLSRCRRGIVVGRSSDAVDGTTQLATTICEALGSISHVDEGAVLGHGADFVL